MTTEQILINGQWQDAKKPSGTFCAFNPANTSPLTQQFPISGIDDINELITAGKQAATALQSASPESIALFLELYAEKIESRAEELSFTANLETALPKETRLGKVELARTTGQLRQAAAASRERSWCQATIDTQTNIRRKYGPLGGPVIVFGPNNFPLAFNSISGGDFAAAIASGNPVIAKANPAHPGTTKILAQAAHEALCESDLPPATVQLLYHTTPELGFTLISHPAAGAAAFTGSKTAGLALKEIADKAGKPIYLEMSSVNPVFILPGALSERADAIASELFSSCSLGAGQFCTNPGLIIVLENEKTHHFIQTLSSLFSQNSPGILFTASGVENIARAVNTLKNAGAEIITGGKKTEGGGYSYENTLLRVKGDDFLCRPDIFQTEAFGTCSLIVSAKDAEQMVRITSHLEGNLTGCIYSDTSGNDDPLYTKVELILRTKVGRLINDKMPTGVAVVPSMNHGGPYPATGHPGFTSVGIPTSMLRFSALHCYDNVRPHRLPPELKDKNPTGKMWRLINGEWTRRDI